MTDLKRAKRSLKGKPIRSRWFKVRLFEEELEELRKIALSEGMTISELARVRLLGKVKDE